MGGKRMTREEFDNIATTMIEVPRKKKETQSEYFKRLQGKYNVKRSRWLLQIIEGAVKNEPEDLDKSYELYEMKIGIKKEKENRKAQMEKVAEELQTMVELVYDPSIAEEYRKEQEMRREMAKVPMTEGESWIEQIPKSAIVEKENAEEQIPGQMRMDLTPEKPEMSDQTKLMRFWAGQADKIAKVITDEMAQAIIEIQNSAVMLNTKLDRLNDTLCMILRTVRKE